MNEAILLLAYGGPESLEDIPAYLRDVRGGRETPPRVIAESVERYRQIGGSSPLLGITQSTARKLSETLGLPVYVGMRHWRPYIRDTVAQMAADGVQRCIATCMAPHYSALSIGAYRSKLDEALSAAGAGMTVDFVESWHTEPHYLDGIAAGIWRALRRFPVAAPVLVVFTAHSLPASILERGDPYPEQVMETARLVALRAGLAPTGWTLAYQSAARTGVPWLGPQIEELTPQLAEAGERYLLIAPVGFVADHVEVLYDLDIAVKRIGEAAGMTVERTPMLNDSPPLIEALAEIARARLS